MRPAKEAVKGHPCDAKLLLDHPTGPSFRIGKSVVPPIKSTADIGSSEWVAETESYMRRLRDQTKRDGDWSKYVFLHACEHRWRALAAILPHLSPTELPALFREVWMKSEDIWRERRSVKKVISLIPERSRRQLFSKKDRTRFDALPDLFPIFRGAKRWNLAGMSWTLDIDRAVYFATHHNQEGMACSLPPGEVGIVMERRFARTLFCFTPTRGLKMKSCWSNSRKGQVLRKACFGRIGLRTDSIR
jgi:hypothetical protein